jgi:hypothetical protein
MASICAPPVVKFGGAHQRLSVRGSARALEKLTKTANAK